MSSSHYRLHRQQHHGIDPDFFGIGRVSGRPPGASIRPRTLVGRGRRRSSRVLPRLLRGAATVRIGRRPPRPRRCRRRRFHRRRRRCSVLRRRRRRGVAVRDVLPRPVPPARAPVLFGGPVGDLRRSARRVEDAVLPLRAVRGGREEHRGAVRGHGQVGRDSTSDGGRPEDRGGRRRRSDIFCRQCVESRARAPESTAGRGVRGGRPRVRPSDRPALPDGQLLLQGHSLRHEDERQGRRKEPEARHQAGPDRRQQGEGGGGADGERRHISQKPTIQQQAQRRRRRAAVCLRREGQRRGTDDAPQRGGGALPRRNVAGTGRDER
mmetsp:Transcript_48106/g.102329  ORF Transcript_48106/g.102329 Transcript_48106/m.102329 type:complete len:323 (+) Transcript_48106:72-1040(+)